MKKRVLALALALCLLLSMPAFALGSSDFNNGKLSGVALLGDGSMLVTDIYNKVVWRVASGRVSSFAGVIPVPDMSGEPKGVFRNGAADQAYFMEPWDVAPFLNGCAVTDTAANMVRYIENGRVMTLAGSQKAGNTDGKAQDALFNRPTGLALDNEGNLYVADTGNGAIRRIDKSGAVSTVARELAEPTGICWYNGALYVAETGRCRICRVSGGSVSVVAGVSVPAEDEGEFYGGYADAPLASARFDHPQGVAVDANGTLYVADTGNSAVRMIRDGRVFTLLRGNGRSISPASPRGVLVRGETLYVTDAFAGTLTELPLTEKMYADVAPDAWYAETVRLAVRSGIAAGTDAGFEPNAPMDRAMFVEMLSRVHLLVDGTTIIDGDAAFADVADDASYAAAVRWAADNEIVLGNDDGTFAPNRGISRQELAALLYRYAKQQGLTDLVGGYADVEKFSDSGDISSWAIDAMRWACTKHILNGDDAGRLNPRGQATRAHALTMLLNFMNAYGL
ncbi:MAG: S-layer homology domain-containing protein [Oscillospiraceae bacterium]|nr:S-layer homology domain-containing protein [Oscillospiraceae bacterium]